MYRKLCGAAGSLLYSQSCLRPGLWHEYQSMQGLGKRKQGRVNLWAETSGCQPSPLVCSHRVREKLKMIRLTGLTSTSFLPAGSKIESHSEIWQSLRCLLKNDQTSQTFLCSSGRRLRCQRYDRNTLQVYLSGTLLAIDLIKVLKVQASLTYPVTCIIIDSNAVICIWS